MSRLLLNIRRRLAGLIIALLARVLVLLTRSRVVHSDERLEGPIIYAFRHGDQLGLLPYPRPRPTAAMVSHSADGELQSHVLSHLGLHVIRGSSSAGGASALASCLKWLRKRRDLAMAVDGPRGPAGRSKPGVIWLSEKTMTPIVAVACWSARSRRLRRSWDHFLIPLPFSRTWIASAPPFRPWERDWTEPDKLTYLDSLIEKMEASARAEAILEAEDDGNSGQHRRQVR